MKKKILIRKMKNHNTEVKCTHLESKSSDMNVNIEEMHEDNDRNNQNLYCNTNFARLHKCLQCNLTFDRASQHGYHYRSFHLGEKSQICQICGKGFFRKADLRTHLNIHLGTNQCICEICGRKFNHVSNLIRHCRMHRGMKPYPCSICGERFTQISSLVRHKRTHENGKEQADDNVPDNPAVKSRRRYYCRICGESFVFLFLLKEHKKSHLSAVERVEHKNGIEEQDDQRDKIVYAISEQFEKENLEQAVDAANYYIQNQLEKNANKVLDATSNRPVDSYDCPLISDRIIPWKFDEKEQVNEISNDENANTRSIEHLTDNACIDEMLIFKVINRENENYERYLSSDENGLYIGTLEEETFKCTDPCSIVSFEKQDRILCDTNAIGNDNDQLNGNSFVDKEENFPHEIENMDKDIDSNMTRAHEGPSLRLVQTETGEEFYELVINTFPEKGNDVRRCFEENSQIEEDSVKIPSQENEQELQCFADANTDLQVEFEKYVRTNMDAFEKSNYENSADQFLEFIEIASESVTNKDSLTVCVIPNEEEQLCGSSKDTRTTKTKCRNESNSFDLVTYETAGNSLNGEGPSWEINSRSDLHNDISKDIPENKDREDWQELKKSETFLNTLETKDGEDWQESKKSKTFSKKFQCNVCDKAFTSSYNYKQHVGTHFTDQRSFRCKECGRSFAWKSTLNKHIASNHRQDGPQKFVCEICPKVYNTLSQVNEHVKRDHLKQRNHICPHCGKSFFKKSDMETHSRTHTDERPYACRTCGKRFHHQSHIIRHERTHSGERPYACDICEKTFAQAGSLKAHKQKHRSNERNISDYQIDEDDPLVFVSV